MKSTISYLHRKEEIRKFIESDDLSKSTSRLMDFVTDFFPTDKPRKRETTNFKAEWNNLRVQLRQFPSSKEIADRKQAFRMSILMFLDDLCEELEEKQKALSVSTKINREKYPVNQKGANARESQKLTRYEKEKETFLKKARNENEVVRGRNLIKTYSNKGGVFKLGPINISLKLGEITSVVGENGSGKSTLLKIIARIGLVENGQLSYPLFDNLGRNTPYETIQQIAYIPQTIDNWYGSITDALSYSASIHGLRGNEIKSEVDFIINRLDLAKYKDLNIGQLSVGYKMRFALARELIWHPKLLVLDEPLANLDINAQELFLRDLRDITNSIAYPMTTIISSQHLHKVENITDNIIFLREGKTLFNGSIFNLASNQTNNVFEIGCRLSKSEFLDLIDGIDYLNVIDKDNTFLIYTQKSVNTSTILKMLAEKNVNVFYFRDISNSSRRLFLDDHV